METMNDSLVLFIGKYLVLFFILPFIYFWLKGNKKMVIHAFLAVVLADAAALLIGVVFPTLRPFEAAGASPRVPIFFWGGSLQLRTASFPSKHAAVSSSVALSVFGKYKVYGIFLALAAFLVGAGRVLAYVHRWYDVVGGFGIGLLATVVAGRILEHEVVGGFIIRLGERIPPRT